MLGLTGDPGLSHVSLSRAHSLSNLDLSSSPATPRPRFLIGHKYTLHIFVGVVEEHIHAVFAVCHSFDGLLTYPRFPRGAVRLPITADLLQTKRIVTPTGWFPQNTGRN